MRTINEFIKTGLIKPFNYDATSVPKENGPLRCVVSNEFEYELFEGILRRPPEEQGKGIYIGLGAEQNYTMMGYCRPSGAILFDYDPAVVATHLLYRAAFLSSDTPEDFEHFFKEDNLDNVRQMLGNLYGDNPQLHEAVLKIAENIYDMSKLEIRSKFLRTEHTFRNGIGFTHTYLSSTDDYNWVRHLYQDNQIIITTGNLYNQAFLVTLSSVIRGNQDDTVAFYISNAHEYTENGFMDNIQGIKRLGTSPKSLLLTTTHSGATMRTLGGPWNTHGGNDWFFASIPLQSIPDAPIKK